MLHPIWNEKFTFDVENPESKLEIKIVDKEAGLVEWIIGETRVSLKGLEN